ncbi:hypothetical protein BAOM_4271 [Peribacillus asahii]|uniref:Sin domain-containing protein n=1 Tax=Peribacillus asahii TaxID=228899 RepID=A0A3T0KX22_9BACI|nr:hypothetical protein BAOM_4271 [Peribacillus asahii]
MANKQTKFLYSKWIELILEAREMDITVKEIRDFPPKCKKDYC